MSLSPVRASSCPTTLSHLSQSPNPPNRPLSQPSNRVGKTIAGLLMSLMMGIGMFVFFANPELTWAAKIPAPAPPPGQGEVCFATGDDGATVHQSGDSQAVRDAIADAVTGGSAMVKLAGYCAGSIYDPDYLDNAIGIIDTPMTILGGYTYTDWTTAYPITQPTVLDAQQKGHGLIATAPLTVSGFTVLNGYVDINANYYDGAGIFAGDSLVVSDMKFYSNTNADYGGGIYANTLWMTNTELAYNDAGEGGGVYVAESLAVPNAPQILLPAPLNAYVSKSIFYNNWAYDGGGMAVFSAQIRDSQFISNVADEFGGGLYADYYADISGSVFEANESWDSLLICCAPQHDAAKVTRRPQRHRVGRAAPNVAVGGGGGAWLGYADITATQFIRNNAVAAGGGLYLDVGAAITGTDFISNIAALPILGAPLPDINFTPSNGAGLGCAIINVRDAPADVGELQINGGRFVQNESEGNGGGAASFCDTYITGTQFISNSSANAGGGLMAEAFDVVISGTQFISNVVQVYDNGVIPARPHRTRTNQPAAIVPGDGGGAWLNGAVVQIIGSRFEDNLANGVGGGAVLYNGGEVHRSQFIGNIATEWGGGLIVWGDALVDQSFFLDNTAEDGGGLDIESAETYVAVNNSVFARNMAHTGDGAAIWTGADLNLLHNTVTASDAVTHSAIYLDDSDVVLMNTVIANHAIGVDGFVTGTVVGDHNLFYGVVTETVITDAIGITLLNTLVADPMFVNPTGNAAIDFRSNASSRAIDGAIDSNLKVDYSDAPRPQGLGPDIGAFETLAVADLAIAIWPTPAIVHPGEPLTFTVVVTNNGPDMAYDAVITTAVDANLQPALCASRAVGCLANVPFITVTVPQLAANAVQTVTVNGIVNPAITDDVLLWGEAGVQALRDSNAGNNYAAAAAQVQVFADLAISKWASAPTVIAGQRITYSVVFTNTGPGVAHTVRVTDVLPAGLQSVACQAQVGMICTVGVGRTTLSVPSMGIGESYAMTVSGQIDPDAATGSMTNTVQLSAANDVNLTNNTANAVVGVQTLVDIVVDKSVAPNVVIAGTRLTYTLVLTNNGPSVAHSVVFTDVLANELKDATCASMSGAQCAVNGNAVRGQVDILGVNQAHVFVIAATVKSDVAQGTLVSNSVQVSTAAPDPNTANGGGNASVTPPEATALIQAQADLSITVQPVNQLVQSQLGQIKVVINNAGPSYARPVTASIVLPNGLSNEPSLTARFAVHGSQAVWTCAANGPTVTCNTPVLADGAADQFLLNVRASADAPESVTIVASVQSGATDPVAANNSSSQIAAITRPTAVVLARFAVEGNRVVWVTSAEIDTYGFHLWRSATGQRADAERITPDLIPARGRQGGASYEFVDAAAQPNTRYTYWLQEIELDGDAIDYGPARIIVGRIFVPILANP